MEKQDSKEDYFINPDGLKLFRVVYPSNIQPMKAVVFVCHGLFEHCQFQFYEQLIQPLNNIGCMTVAHDHQGHGKSEGKRGMVYDLQVLVRDVLLDIDETLAKYEVPKDIPVFIYGHSMGGLMTVYAVAKRKLFFKGMCLEAPALMIPPTISKLTLMNVNIISKIRPTFKLGTTTASSEICRNSDFDKVRSNDKYVIREGVSAKTTMTILKAVKEVQNCFKDIEIPLIVGHGDADKICDIEGSRRFVENCSVKDKTLLTYPGAKHHVRSESDNVDIEFRTKIVEWINNKIME